MKKIIKRIAALALAVVLIAGVFAGCSGNGAKGAQVGLFYCSAEANSKYQVEKVAEELAKLGYATKEYSFADSNDLASVLNTAIAESKALYIPTDNICANNAELINNICEPAGIPIIAGEEGICEGCGVATPVSYTHLTLPTKA